MKTPTTKLVSFICFISIILISSCQKGDDCDGVDCFTEPAPFLFEFIDKDSGENLIANGTFKKAEFIVINTESGNAIEFTIAEEGTYTNMLAILGIGWETEKVNCSVQVTAGELFTLYVDAKRTSENCCSSTKYNEIEIEGSGFELNEQSGIYKILLE